MTKTKRNELWIITGAAGTGKNTVSEYLHTQYGIPRVLTHTTRPPRPGEADGVSYYFETPESFATKHLIEQVTYDGHQYGSSREALQKAWERHRIVSLVLDTEGAKSYIRTFGDHIFLLFITVRHPASLRERMIDRGDQPVAVEARLHSPEYQRDLKLPDELSQVAHIIHNDTWVEAKKEIDTLLKQEAVRMQTEKY
ncbi:guanylate kinase [Schleiferilactobacillus perolens]|jgi:guanylate kinase|uniref:Gmk, Guanylate kinase n=1 Tax=Schleiferilactobacillus perolens DSM 12744 TaxID=1423792 RepID=A0A0R1MRR0_9LACO|nr:guanylate kinase [Schleiferilactobacillus perolens]KRL10782.1 Gmk, Guanylate kinase [Schleiferilactobacillus perolens DSM 12744]MCI2171577.1 guanylate kinase [Schleiferilactobacillus perolens]